MSKFEQYLLEVEEDNVHASEYTHKGGLTSAEVDAIRKKEGIKFNPDAGHPTQRSNTIATYHKFYSLIPDENKKGLGLDYSAGLGMGSEALRNEYHANIESYEPFPNSRAVNITHKGLNSLPNKKYEYIINSAVLNVVEQDIRDNIVKDIFNHLEPDGVAIIGVRSRADVMGTKTALVLSQENGEILDRSRGSYQKGFTTGELVNYIRTIVPEAIVTPVKGMSQVTVKVTKDTDMFDKKDAPEVDSGIKPKKPLFMKYLNKDKEE